MLGQSSPLEMHMVLAARSHELSALTAGPCGAVRGPAPALLGNTGLSLFVFTITHRHRSTHHNTHMCNSSKRSSGRHVAPRWGESHPWIGEPWRRSCTSRNLTGLGGPAEDILVGMVELHPGGTVGTAHRRRRTRTPVVHHNTHLVVRRNTVGVPVDSRGARHSSSSNRAHSCRAMPCRAP